VRRGSGRDGAVPAEGEEMGRASPAAAGFWCGRWWSDIVARRRSGVPAFRAAGDGRLDWTGVWESTGLVHIRLERHFLFHVNSAKTYY
jgi:hypothetical protein